MRSNSLVVLRRRPNIEQGFGKDPLTPSSVCQREPPCRTSSFVSCYRAEAGTSCHSFSSAENYRSVAESWKTNETQRESRERQNNSISNGAMIYHHHDNSNILLGWSHFVTRRLQTTLYNYLLVAENRVKYVNRWDSPSVETLSTELSDIQDSS